MSLGLNVRQLLERVVRPALRAMPSLPMGAHVEQILLMIAAHESDGFHFLYQRPDGPAIGLWQMEPFTFEDLRDRVAPKVPGVHAFCGGMVPTKWELAGNLFLACAYARLKLYASPGALPGRDEKWAQARYAKQFYNSPKGKATVEKYVRAYETQVEPIGLWLHPD